MLKLVLAALAMLAMAAAATSPTLEDFRAATAANLQADIDERLAIFNAHPITTRAACSTYTSACDCEAAVEACVWYIGVESSQGTTTGTQQPSASVKGLCTAGNAATGPDGNVLSGVLNVLPGCWWPSSLEGISCTDRCTYRAEASILNVYFRSEITFAPDLVLSAASDVAKIFNQVSFSAFIMYATPSGANVLPIFTGNAYMKAGAGTSVGANGLPGVRGAAFFTLIDSWFTYPVADFANGYDGTGTAPTFNAVSGVTLTKQSDVSTGSGVIKANKWTMSTSLTGGGSLSYVCWFGKEKFELHNSTYNPYDVKCDLVVSGANVPAGQAFGLRMVIASAKRSISVSGSASATFDLGTGSIAFAPTASVSGSADISVTVAAPTDCGDISSPWFSNTDVLSTLSENLGAARHFACSFVSFKSAGAGTFTWDPESKIDKAKAEGEISAKSPAVSVASAPALIAVAALFAALVALSF